ncbi:MAG: hypothetical protein ACLFQR_02550 [Desulfovibrionales bacterium]
MKERTDLLRGYIADMAALERHIQGAVIRQFDDHRVRQSPDVMGMLARINQTLEAHRRSLESALESYGGRDGLSVLKTATTSLTGMVTGIYDRVRRNDPVSRDLRDNYTALNLAAASYSMLHTTGLALEDPDVAKLALHHLKDYTALIMELSRMIPAVVVQELSEKLEGVAQSVAEQAVENTARAWSPEEVKTL